MSKIKYGRVYLNKKERKAVTTVLKEFCKLVGLNAEISNNNYVQWRADITHTCYAILEYLHRQETIAYLRRN